MINLLHLRNRAALPLLAMVSALSLMSCGFQPLYAPGPSTTPTTTINFTNNTNQNTTDDFRSVHIARIPDEAGVILHNYLIDRLYLDGVPTNPMYRLDVSINQSRREIGILSDDTATRAQLMLSANARLVQTTDSQPAWQQRYSTIASYNILENQFATQVAREDALDRGLRRLGDQLTQGLALHFRR